MNLRSIVYGFTVSSKMAGNSVEVDSDKNNGNMLLNLICPDLIQRATVEIKRSHQRSRKVRLKLLEQINLYFFQIVENIYENDAVCNAVIYLHDLQDLILETTALCISLSHPQSKINEIYDTMYDMGAYMEALIVAMYSWCKHNGRLFGELVTDLLRNLIKVSEKYPESWIYSVLISPLVLHMINAFAVTDHNEFRTEWSLDMTELMKQIASSIFKCGDFGCQYYLMTVFSAWKQWTPGAIALTMINTVFSYVDPVSRKTLMMESNADMQSLRKFLNALNLSVGGPKSVIPIQCLYLFVCDHEIRRPENSDVDFWVDFSIGSGRIHAFCSLPGASLASLSIRQDQIDSVCLNWVVNDGRSSQQSGSFEMDEDTPSTILKDEKVLFFHVLLNVDFDAILKDDNNLLGKGYRSIYFVFRDGDLIETVMKDMNFHQHMCGTRNCERPRTLRNSLARKNKLSYTKSWCPNSQIFGLDESPLSTDTKADRSSFANLVLKAPIRTPGASYCQDTHELFDCTNDSDSSDVIGNTPESEFNRSHSSRTPGASYCLEPKETPGAIYCQSNSGRIKSKLSSASTPEANLLLRTPIRTPGASYCQQTHELFSFPNDSDSSGVIGTTPESKFNISHSSRTPGASYCLEPKETPGAIDCQSNSGRIKSKSSNASTPEANLLLRTPIRTPGASYCQQTHELFSFPNDSDSSGVIGNTPESEFNRSHSSRTPGASYCLEPKETPGAIYCQSNSGRIKRKSSNSSTPEANLLLRTPIRTPGASYCQQTHKLFSFPNDSDSSVVIGNTPESEFNRSHSSRTPGASYCLEPKETPGAIDCKSNSGRIKSKLSNASTPEANVLLRTPIGTPGASYCQQSHELFDCNNDSDSSDVIGNTPESEFNRSHSSRTPGASYCLEPEVLCADETPGAFYVSASSHQTEAKSYDSFENALPINTTTATNNDTYYEDPLPLSARKKFKHLCLHTPFLVLSPSNSSSAKISLKHILEVAQKEVLRESVESAMVVQDTFVRNSSPIGNAPICQSFSPAVSDITTWNSPKNNINITQVDNQISSCDEMDENDEEVMAIRSETNSEHEFECAASLFQSPVFGYSRTLVNECTRKSPPSIKKPTPNVALQQSVMPNENVATEQDEKNRKSLCYSDAFIERLTKESSKHQDCSYDPYDLLMCSEFDEYKKKIFPKLKTYAGKREKISSKKSMVPVRNHTAENLKGKPKKRLRGKSLALSQRAKTLTNNNNVRKYASFLKKSC